jgi:Fe-S-cluster containining protein
VAINASKSDLAAPKKIRACGSCNACCIILRIDSEPGYSTRFDSGEDIAKPAGVPCRYLTSMGCGIYDVRPLVCRSFKCDWLKGMKGFADGDNPIKAGYFGMRGSRFSIKPHGNGLEELPQKIDTK